MVVAPVLIAALVALRYVAANVRRELGSALPVLAGVVLLGAAVGADVAGGRIVEEFATATGLEHLASGAVDELDPNAPSPGLLHSGRRTVEELLELTGAFVLVVTFAAMLERRLRRRNAL